MHNVIEIPAIKMTHFNLVATNGIDLDILTSQEKLIELYIVEDPNGFLKLESGYAKNFQDLNKLISFLFKTNQNLIEIAPGVFDLSKIRKNCLSEIELENQYQNWLSSSHQENTMDEFGQLICLISYVHRNSEKDNLLLVLEQ